MKKYISFTLIFLFSIAISSFFVMPEIQAENNISNFKADNTKFLIASNHGDESVGDENGDESVGSNGGTVNLSNPLGEDSIIGVINNIITGLRDTIAPPLVAIAVLYGGFLMLFASGDPEKFKKGKKAILYAMVGYAIILVAGGITSLIKDIVGG